MKLRVEWSKRARRDIADVWRYSFDNWGEGRADAYVESVRQALDLLSTNIGIARSADDIRPGLLKYLVGGHLIFFRTAENTIRVVRILHGRRDFSRHL